MCLTAACVPVFVRWFVNSCVVLISIRFFHDYYFCRVGQQSVSPNYKTVNYYLTWCTRLWIHCSCFNCNNIHWSNFSFFGVYFRCSLAIDRQIAFHLFRYFRLLVTKKMFGGELRLQFHSFLVILFSIDRKNNN